MTYRQAGELGGQVCRGEKGELVVYANTVTRTEQDADGNDKDVEIPFLRGFTAFNCDQIDGLPAHYYQLAEPVRDPVARIEHAEGFFAATGLSISHGGNRAYYSLTHDRIQMPPFETFRDAESNYATLAHEATHATMHSLRLNRDFGRKDLGNEAIAREELVAELCASFLSADLELALDPREDHACYIESCLKVLQNAIRAIFSAAAHAQRAADYLHSLQPQAQAEATARQPLASF